MSKRLGTIVNNDCNNIYHALDGSRSTSADYQRVVRALLAMGPGVLAQDVGMPDAVVHRTQVATPVAKHLVEVTQRTWPDANLERTRRDVEFLTALDREGTDVLDLTVRACREAGVPVVASFRMNSEDLYGNTWMMSDFGRQHPEYRIPGRGCLDPAVSQVFEYRMRIFAEVASTYDLDGVELNFRRWYHMVSDPPRNHGVLTRMVRDVRQVLDRAARTRGRGRMLLGARVGSSIDLDPDPFRLPGAAFCRKPEESSCRELGLDVRTWVEEGLVDYLCPTQFIGMLPGLPVTQQFADLARDTEVGVYPTLWCMASWMHEVLGFERRLSWREEDRGALAVYKHDLCSAALRLYADGADGISTFNWYAHLRTGGVPHLWTEGFDSPGDSADAVLVQLAPLLGDPGAVQEYAREPWAVPGRL